MSTEIDPSMEFIGGLVKDHCGYYTLGTLTLHKDFAILPRDVLKLYQKAADLLQTMESELSSHLDDDSRAQVYVRQARKVLKSLKEKGHEPR